MFFDVVNGFAGVDNRYDHKDGIEKNNKNGKQEHRLLVCVWLRKKLELVQPPARTRQQQEVIQNMARE